MKKQVEASIQSDSPAQLSTDELSNESFDRMISEVEDYAIILLSTTGHIMTWNKGAQRIKGYNAEEIIGRSFKLFYPPEDLEINIPDMLLESARQAGKAEHEGWRMKRDGTRFWGNVTITALHDNDGRINGFLKVTRDLTQKKIAEDKLSNYIEELRFKNEELKVAEERYHKMVEEVKDYAIILLDPQGKVLDWNKGAEKLKGYAASEIVGKSFRLFYPRQEKEARLPERLLGEAAQNGSANNEGYRIRKDGTRFWGNVAITALRNEANVLIGFSKVTKDLTDRKISDDRISIFTRELRVKNEELQRSEERYHKMIAEVQDYAIILLDVAGNIQNWNEGAALIKGYKANEIVGKNFRVFYTQEDLQKGVPDKLLSEAASNGRAHSEGWRKRKDGTKFWGNITITGLHGANGDIIGFSKVTRDLTAKKRADEAASNHALTLELKNHELERLNAELASFSYVVSHDFKEPIRKIQVFGNRQLEPGTTIEQVREYSEKIVISAQRMQSLMEALLSYSLISNNSAPHENVNLNEVLEATKSDLEVLISESHAVIESTKLPTVAGISFQLQQLFLNLVTNSIKFSKPGEAPFISIISREISANDTPEQLLVKNRSYYQISFSDKGLGFDSSQAERIFTVFQRLKPKTSTTGTGIGLAIVKRVVLNHDGLVVASGEPNAGATFTVYLPVGQVNLA